jgi:hypothetical protein
MKWLAKQTQSITRSGVIDIKKKHPIGCFVLLLNYAVFTPYPTRIRHYELATMDILYNSLYLGKLKRTKLFMTV